MGHIERARELRKQSTDAEIVLWSLLRNRSLCNLKFKRQFTIGPFIVDFACLDKKLIIELDGSQHLDSKEYDEERTLYLNHRGFHVIRFWNDEVFNHKTAVLEKILFAAALVKSI